MKIIFSILLLILGTAFYLISCNQNAGGGAGGGEANLIQILDQKNCSQEVKDSYISRINRLKRSAANKNLNRRIQDMITLAKAHSCQ